MKILNKTYNINSELNSSIILISDLHYVDKTDIDRLNYILENIKQNNPKFICIPGDIIDKSKVLDEDIFIDWLKKLSTIAKVIISIGNHEFYVDKSKKVFKLDEEFYKKLSKINNLYVLDNKNIILDSINFIGLTIKIENYYKKDKIKESLNKINIEKNCYNVLLCHSPIDICGKNVLKGRNINLVLCGHMHGGIVPNFLRPIFKNRGIISPRETLFPKNSYGILKIGNTNVIITSGCRVLPFKKLKNLFRPEIVKINLTFK